VIKKNILTVNFTIRILLSWRNNEEVSNFIRVSEVGWRGKIFAMVMVMVRVISRLVFLFSKEQLAWQALKERDSGEREM